MATLDALVTLFTTTERPVGVLLDEQTVLAQAIAATRFYAGYAVLRARENADSVLIDKEIDITESEWALIRPLFMLYTERETALQQEASRMMGVEPFGRSTSEIISEIAQAEADMPRKAFFQAIVTV